MRARLVEAIVRGDVIAWAFIGALWLAVAAILVLQGRARPSPARVLTLLSLCALTSIAGLVAAAALAVPRVRWRPVDEPDLVSSGGTTWRRLHGPAVPVTADGAPDIGIPAIDAQGRWLLIALLAGRPVDGLAPAPEASPASAQVGRGRASAAPADAGAPRLCHPDQAVCRPWPAGWPAPERPPAAADIQWAENYADGAIAYDVETGRFFYAPPGLTALELSGDLSATTLKPATPLTQLLLFRRAGAGRLTAARVVARQAWPFNPTYIFQRADVSITAGRTALYAVLPLLFAGVLALPLAALAYLLAPAWLAASRRRAAAPEDPAPLAATARGWLSHVAHPIAIALTGAAAASPAAVAIATLLSSR